MGKLIDRTSERKLMNCGLYAEIIEYKSYENIAVKYKDKIPQKLYNAMYNYEVEITD